MLKNQHVALDFWFWPQTTCAQGIPTPFVLSSFLADHRMTPSPLPHPSSVSDCTFPHATAGLFMCWRMEGDRTRPSAGPLPSHCLRSLNNSCIWLPFASSARLGACVCACVCGGNLHGDVLKAVPMTTSYCHHDLIYESSFSLRLSHES